MAEEAKTQRDESLLYHPEHGCAALPEGRTPRHGGLLRRL